MWLVVSGDGDVAYTHAYGPFNTEAEATAALPADTDDIRWSAIELEDPTKIVHDPELMDDDDDDPTTPAVTPVGVPQVRYSPAVDALMPQYGALENVPAPNANVYTYANSQIQAIKQRIANSNFDKSFFTAEEGKQLAQMLRSIGIDDDAVDFADHDRFDQEVQELQVQLMFFEELARQHRPRAGF